MHYYVAEALISSQVAFLFSPSCFLVHIFLSTSCRSCSIGSRWAHWRWLASTRPAPWASDRPRRSSCWEWWILQLLITTSSSLLPNFSYHALHLNFNPILSVLSKTKILSIHYQVESFLHINLKHHPLSLKNPENLLCYEIFVKSI